MHILRVHSKELKKKEWLEAESSEKWFQQLPGAEKVVRSSSPMELEGLGKYLKLLFETLEEPHLENKDFISGLRIMP